jgi:hypothetical protein
MSKRKDVQEIWFQLQQTGASGEALETAWDLGRIAGLRQAAKMCYRSLIAFNEPAAFRAEARRLAKKLKAGS